MMCSAASFFNFAFGKSLLVAQNGICWDIAGSQDGHFSGDLVIKH